MLRTANPSRSNSRNFRSCCSSLALLSDSSFSARLPSCATKEPASGAATAGRGAETVSPKARMRASAGLAARSEEHTSELQSLMRISYAVFCLQKEQLHEKAITHSTIATARDLMA